MRGDQRTSAPGRTHSGARWVVLDSNIAWITLTGEDGFKVRMGSFVHAPEQRVSGWRVEAEQPFEQSAQRLHQATGGGWGVAG